MNAFGHERLHLSPLQKRLYTLNMNLMCRQTLCPAKRKQHLWSAVSTSGCLVELLDTPSRIPVMVPMILREIHYYLLCGNQGRCLRLFSTTGTQANQIAEAISWLRKHYADSINMEELARRVNMASSTFNRHFRQVTSLSPLQFQKRLRLYEAERLMLQEGKDAETAALMVGYESGSQFNRSTSASLALLPAGMWPRNVSDVADYPDCQAGSSLSKASRFFYLFTRKRSNQAKNSAD